MTLTPDATELLRCVDGAVWRDEAALIPAFYERFGDRLPAALWAQYEALIQRLGVDLEGEDETPAKIALSA